MSRRLPILSLVLLATLAPLCGCRSDPSVKLLEAEAQMWEDRYYEASAELAAIEDELDSLKRMAAHAPAPARVRSGPVTPYRTSPPSYGPRIEADSHEAEDIKGPEDLGPVDIDLGLHSLGPPAEGLTVDLNGPTLSNNADAENAARAAPRRLAAGQPAQEIEDWRSQREQSVLVKRTQERPHPNAGLLSERLDLDVPEGEPSYRTAARPGEGGSGELSDAPAWRP